jgi:putative porin
MKLIRAMMLLISFGVVAEAQTVDVENLQKTVQDQSREIDELKARIARIEQLLSRSVAAEPGAVVQTAAFRENITAAPVVRPAQAAPAQPQVAGFRFSGDFRLRLDAAVRGASSQATGLQNIRGRYRLRMNADRDVTSKLNFHMQLSTGAVNNGITFDQDFAGGVTRQPFFISEGYIDYHPSTNVSIRAGRVEEIFADNFRFLWDDDVRFNGVNERVKKGRLELKAGQYFFINPNIFTVPVGSPLTLAGIQPGTIARASQMYHQGFTFETQINPRWKQQFTSDIQLYRNPRPLLIMRFCSLHISRLCEAFTVSMRRSWAAINDCR